MEFNMGWPEWIIVTLIAIGVITRMAKATGWRPKDNASNGAYSFSIIAYPALWLGLLYWGGFFQ